MTASLADFQQGFVQALGFAGAGGLPPPSCARQAAFAVYRNTVMKGCIDALQANFPSAVRLVGDEWFRGAAAEFVRTEPPTDARLMHYGAALPAFLDALLARAGHQEALPYLSGVARLDQLWRESHVAADAEPADATLLAALAPEQLAALVLRPHPAARWAWFPDMPVFGIWRTQREPGDEAADDLPWHGDGALLARPGDTVQWQALDAAGCAFLDACAAGLNLNDAAGEAMLAKPDIDLGALLQRLLQAGALCGPAAPVLQEMT